MKVLITGGATKAYIDDLRFISNYSTGKLSSLIAEGFLKKGMKVVFLHGEGSILPCHCESRFNRIYYKYRDEAIFKHKNNYREIEIVTVDDLIKYINVLAKKEKFDVIIHSMAVLDYIPRQKAKGKIPSERKYLNIRFKRTPKVIDLIRRKFPKAVLVGFKLEHGKSKERLIAKAKKLIENSRADIVVANDFKTIFKGNHTAYIIKKIKKDRYSTQKAAGKKYIAKKLINALL